MNDSVIGPVSSPNQPSGEAMVSSSTRIGVFISYSHADREWLERLKRHLKPLVREGYLDCWDDTHIQPGDDWQQEIRAALDRAQAAVLLISADFFASDFIDEAELPPLLAAAQAKGVRILPVILGASRFARHPSLARFQAINSPDQPLNEMPPAEQEKVLDRLVQTIERAVQVVKCITAPVRDEAKPSYDLKSECGMDYGKLESLLNSHKWKSANRETIILLVRASGRRYHGPLDSPENLWTLGDTDIEHLPCSDLILIDLLWSNYSSNRFGFSVQSNILDDVNLARIHAQSWVDGRQNILLLRKSKGASANSTTPFYGRFGTPVYQSTRSRLVVERCNYFGEIPSLQK